MYKQAKFKPYYTTLFTALNLADLRANALARCLKFMTRRLLNLNLYRSAEMSLALGVMR